MNYPENLLYSADHEWLKIENDEAWIGIIAFAPAALGDIVYLDIALTGKSIGQNTVFGMIEAVKTVSDLFMPVSGVILEVNPKLAVEPELVNSDPYGEGWLVKIMVTGPIERLISIITSMLNRKGIEMESIHAARTDIHDQVLIHIEVIAEPGEIKNVSAKIGNIIEVEQVELCLTKNSWYQKVALNTIDKIGYNSLVFQKLQKYGATMVGYHNEQVIIEKIGRDEDLQLLYNELEGPHLISLMKSAAISLKPLEDQSSVISMAA